MKKQSKGKVVAFRLWPPYSMLVEEQAKAAKLKEGEFARLATMFVADSGLLDLSERMKRLEEHLIRLRKDFNDAPPGDGGEC